MKQKKSWSVTDQSAETVAKADLHPKKLMLCVYWDYKGVVYYELLPFGQTIDSSKYCKQVGKLKQKIREDRPEFAKR
jgi:histone-lysine N-methyltransferase SETMAR